MIFKKNRKRIDLQNDDKILISFLARHKYCDNVAGKILLNKKNDRAFWKRLKKLKEYKIFRTGKIFLNDLTFNKQPEIVSLIALDDEGLRLTGTQKRFRIATNLKHNLYIKRVCAAIEKMKEQGFEYETEYVHNFKEKTKNDDFPFLSDEVKRIRPDVFILNFNIDFEIELTIKKRSDSYGARLFFSQFLNDYNKTIWITANVNDKIKLINIFNSYRDVWFVYDTKYNLKSFIDGRQINKNLVLTIDDFLQNYEQNILKFAGLF